MSSTESSNVTTTSYGMLKSPLGDNINKGNIQTDNNILYHDTNMSNVNCTTTVTVNKISAVNSLNSLSHSKYMENPIHHFSYFFTFVYTSQS